MKTPSTRVIARSITPGESVLKKDANDRLEHGGHRIGASNIMWNGSNVLQNSSMSS
jgi:hypothetical protein